MLEKRLVAGESLDTSPRLTGFAALLVDPKEFAALMQQTAAIEKRLGDAPSASAIPALRKGITALSGELAQLQADMADPEELARLAGRVDALELLNGSHAETEDAAADLTELETRLYSVVLEKLNDRVDALSQRLDQVLRISDLDTLRAAVTAVLAEFAQLKASIVASAQPEQLRVQTVVEKVEAETDVVSCALGGLEASMADAEHVRELRGKTAELENRTVLIYAY